VKGLNMAKGDDIQQRLIMLGVKVMDLCDQLPTTNAGKHISGQLLRSGTSGAPNYAEARGAESPIDFIHKLGIVLKELNETEIWLEMLQLRNMLPEQALQPVHRECEEMCKIIAVSRRTASERTKKS
jgi:four helix bundle protein